MSIFKKKVWFALSILLVGCGGSGSGDGPADVVYVEYGSNARYLFDETEGSIAYNSEFNDFHGEIVGASRVFGKKGNALDFSKVNGAHVLFDICCYADPNTGAGGKEVSFQNNSFTIFAWVKPTNMSTDKLYPIFGGWYGSVQSMKLRLNKGNIDFLLYPENNGDPITLITSSYVLNNDEWTHVAISYNGSQAIMYINGEEDSYSDIVMPVENIINDYFIGGIPTSHSASSGEHSFPGVIDEFFMSGNVLSKGEIQQRVMEGN